MINVQDNTTANLNWGPKEIQEEIDIVRKVRDEYIRKGEMSKAAGEMIRIIWLQDQRDNCFFNN